MDGQPSRNSRKIILILIPPYSNRERHIRYCGFECTQPKTKKEFPALEILKILRCNFVLKCIDNK